VTEKRCETCVHFKRTFPNSIRLKDYGSCHWPLPKGLKLPAAYTRHGVRELNGGKCKTWEPKEDQC
jgi:hypothetical protein